MSYDPYSDELDLIDPSGPLAELIPHETVRLVGLRRDGPAWRWKQAIRLARSGHARKKVEQGGPIWHAVDFLTHIREELRADLLSGTGLDLDPLLAIWRRPSRRMALEARILAGFSIEEVAAACAVPQAAARDYCDLFFDVTDKLTATAWVSCNVIHGPEIQSDTQRVLYRMAYHGGRHVCERWLAGMERFGRNHDLSTREGRETELLELCVIAEQFPEDCEKRFRTWPSQLDSLSQPVPRPCPTVGGIVSGNVDAWVQGVLADDDATVDRLYPSEDKRRSCRTA